MLEAAYTMADLEAMSGVELEVDDMPPVEPVRFK